MPRADCGQGSRPETDIQGRVPASDYASGRVDRGYRCNARAVAHRGNAGGFKVHRYVDARGQTCAFYDSTLVFPRDVVYNLTSGLGVVVLAMDNPEAAADNDPHLAGDAESARVTAAEQEARPARRLARHRRDLPRHPRRLRREDRLPAPEAAVQHAERRPRARERVRAGRA